MPFINTGGGGGVSGQSVALVLKRVTLTADGTATLPVGEAYVAGSVSVWAGGVMQYPTQEAGAEWITEDNPATGNLAFAANPPANGTKLVVMYAKA